MTSIVLPLVSLIMFCISVLILRVGHLELRVVRSNAAIWTLIAASALPIMAMVAILAAYLIYPNFFDHFEAVVAYISQQVRHNHPIYPDKSSYIEAPYGPLLFYVNSLFAPTASSLVPLKIPGVATFVAATLLLLVLVWRRSRSAAMTAIAAGALLSFDIYFQYDTFAFWNRSEPYLILCAVAGLAILETAPAPAAAVLLGVVCGIATGMKLHGSVYVFPAALAVWFTPPNRWAQLGLACLTGLVTLAVAVAPFLFDQNHNALWNYYAVIVMTSKHALLFKLFMQNLLFSTLMLAPTLVLLTLTGRPVRRRELCLSIGLAVSLAVCTLIGSKAGAGPHHLLPLVPVAIYVGVAVASVARSSTQPNPLPRAVLMAAAAAVLLPFSAYTATRVRAVAAKVVHLQTERAKVSELLGLKDAYPDAEFGLSDNDHFDDYLYRIFALNNDPKTVDFSSWMDYNFAGYSDDLFAENLLKRPNRIWIFPRGEPFSYDNYYTNRPLMSEKFRNVFRSNCSKIDGLTYFQVWRCSG
jgi:hypothetical protein